MAFHFPFSIDRGSVESLTRQIENGFRRAILSGACAPGTRLPSRGEMAVGLGVSEMVVREAMGRLQKENLVVARPHIGCVVQAPDVPRWRARVLLVVPFADGAYYYSALARVFTDLMLENRILTLAVRAPQSKAGKAAVLEELSMLSADFAVLLKPSAVVLKRLEEKEIPFLVLEGSMGEHTEGWLGDCVRHCVRVGVRRVALFHSTSSYSEVIRAFDAVGIRVEEVVTDEPSVRLGVTEAVQRAGLEACARLLKKRKPLPDLFLVPGDEYIAAGVWTALADAGIRVPEDVRFASAYVKGHGPVLPKALTSVLIDPKADAEGVAAHVLARLNGRKRVPSFVPAVRYVPGETFPDLL